MNTNKNKLTEKCNIIILIITKLKQKVNIILPLDKLL